MFYVDRMPASYCLFIAVNKNDMVRFLNTTDRVHIFLRDQIEAYVKFVNQVINDEDFLKSVEKLLPFDGMAGVSMTVLPEKQVLKKMGVMIMRMDFEPALFSLAVSIMINRGKEQLQEHIIFLTACKTIVELQNYVKGSEFRLQVTEQCCKKVIGYKEFLL